MKKRSSLKIITIAIVILVIFASAIRIKTLNKTTLSTKERYKQVQMNEYVKLQNLAVRLIKLETIKNVDSRVDYYKNKTDYSDIKATLDVKKVGELKLSKNEKNILYEIGSSMMLNITKKDGTLLLNQDSEYEGFSEDNPSLEQIKNGKKSFGEKPEQLIVRFRINNETLQKIKDDQYKVKFVISKDSESLNFDYIDLNSSNI